MRFVHRRTRFKRSISASAFSRLAGVASRWRHWATVSTRAHTPPSSTCHACRAGTGGGGERVSMLPCNSCGFAVPCKAAARTQLAGMPLLICFVLVLLAAAAIALWPWWVRRRRARIAARPFPAAWRRLLRRHVPLVSRLPARQQLRLKALMQVFLAEKPIIGCRGLRVTDEVFGVAMMIASLVPLVVSLLPRGRRRRR